VDADRRPELRACGDELAHLARHADPDRIGEDELVGARLCEPRRELEHARRLDPALEGAAERRPQRHRRPPAVRVRALDDLHAGSGRVLDRRAGVPLVELLADREREVHLVERRLAQPVVAAVVQREAGVDDAVAPLDPGHHLFGAGHLRDARRVDEADGLDPRHARRGEPVHELGARCRVQGLRVVLEPVARADVADRDRHRTPSARSRSSSSSSSPSSPP
jgi:hypothetical protein